MFNKWLWRKVWLTHRATTDEMIELQLCFHSSLVVITWTDKPVTNGLYPKTYLPNSIPSLHCSTVAMLLHYLTIHVQNRSILFSKESTLDGFLELKGLSNSNKYIHVVQMKLMRLPWNYIYFISPILFLHIFWINLFSPFLKWIQIVVQV